MTANYPEGHPAQCPCSVCTEIREHHQRAFDKLMAEMPPADDPCWGFVEEKPPTASYGELPAPAALDRKTFHAVSQKLQAAAAKIAEQHGVRILFPKGATLLTTPVGPCAITFPVQVCTVSNGVVWSDAAVRFAAATESRPFNRAALGQTFLHAGESYRFVGFREVDDDAREAMAVDSSGAPKRFALDADGLAQLLFAPPADA